jgi:predicted Zn-dependent peptidase
MDNRASLSLGIWVNAGGRYEDSENKGISHFLEHLLFKGTKNYSCRKLKESIEGVGGSLNGFTSEELTCYLVKIPADYLSLALDVLSDMVINPSLPAVEIEKEKTVILEEIKMYRDQPQSHVHELLDELLWPRQPLGAPIIGTEGSVKSMGKDDLMDFRKRYYTPANIVISAAGDLNHDDLMRKASRIFSKLKPGAKNIFRPAREMQRMPQLKILSKDTEQTHMALGFHALRRDHPLKHALSLLHIIMGANMSSRLFEEVREERGLAYEIGTAVKRFQDTGAFLVHAGIDNSKVEKALALILKELELVKEKLVTEDEFRRAKRFYIGQLKLGLEDTAENMLWIGETVATLDRTYSLPEIIEEASRVSREDLRYAAQRILKEENLNLALIGPLKGRHGKIEKELSIG